MRTDRVLKAVLVAALAGVLCPALEARVKPDIQRAIKEARQLRLNDLEKNPAGFLGQTVAFDCFFAQASDVYRPFHTPFIREYYVNFSVWRTDARLWESKEREKAFFYCFVDRGNTDAVGAVQNLKMFDPVHLVARVETVSDAKAWLTVLYVERIDMPAYSERGLKYIDLGMQRLEARDFAMASDLFEVALAENLPLEARKLVYRHIGLAHYELREYRSAEEALHQAEKLIAAPDPFLLLRLGQSKLYIGEAEGDQARLKEAIAYLEKAINQEPKLAEGHADLGLAHGLLRNFKEAMHSSEFALKLVPGHARALRNQAAIQRLRGDLKQAIALLQKAIVSKPDEPLYHRELGDVFMETGQFVEAETEYRNFITLAPENEQAYYLRARSRLAQDNLDGAVEDLTASIEYGPTYKPSYLLLSEVFQKQKKWADSLNVLKGASETFADDVQIRLLLAELLRKLARWDECTKALEEAVGLAPGDLDLRFQWAQVLADKPTPDRAKAIGILEELLKRRPDTMPARFLAGRLYVETHKPRNALSHLNAYIKENPQDVQALLYRGAAYTQGGVFPKAVASYREVLKVDSTNPYAASNAAYVMCLLGQELESAEAYAGQAYQSDASNLLFAGIYSWALSLADRFEEAKALASALVAQGETAEGCYYSALAEFGLQDIDAAREHVKRALELSKSLPKTRDSVMFIRRIRELEHKVKTALARREREHARRRREEMRAPVAPVAPVEPTPATGTFETIPFLTP